MTWNERLHSVLSSKLNQLAKRTQGYTKSIEMLVYSVALVCQQLGAKIHYSGTIVVPSVAATCQWYA